MHVSMETLLPYITFIDRLKFVVIISRFEALSIKSFNWQKWPRGASKLIQALLDLTPRLAHENVKQLGYFERTHLFEKADF